MRRRAVISIAAACAISACAHQTAPSAQGAPDMAWFDVEGDEPKLAFGPPNSEAVVMLTCAPKSGEVSIVFMADPKIRRHVLNVRSGAIKANLAAEATPLTEFDALLLEGRVPANSPLVTNFAQTGDFAVGVGSATALPRAERQMARGLVTRCAR
jgi:hypothetical protein